MFTKISSEISVARKLMFMNLLTNYEGGLILERFSLWLKSPKKGAKELSKQCLFMWIVIWHLFL